MRVSCEVRQVAAELAKTSIKKMRTYPFQACWENSISIILIKMPLTYVSWNLDWKWVQFAKGNVKNKDFKSYIILILCISMHIILVYPSLCENNWVERDYGERKYSERLWVEQTIWRKENIQIRYYEEYKHIENDTNRKTRSRKRETWEFMRFMTFLYC